MTCYDKRPPPKDFKKHAGETYAQLQACYGVAAKTIRRWLDEVGAPKRRAMHRAVIRIGRDGERVRYESVSTAAEDLCEAAESNIWRAASVHGKSNGYRWEFAKDPSEDDHPIL